MNNFQNQQLQLQMMQHQMRMHPGAAPMPQMMMAPGGKGQRGMMPPISNYTPVPKMENADFSSLRPGESRVMRGYSSSPITEKGASLMATYERVMARPQGTFPDAYSSSRARNTGPMGNMMGGAPAGPLPGATSKPECHFYNSPQGCRNGDTCTFAHTSNKGASNKPGSFKVKCRNQAECTFGNKCKFLHSS